MKTCGTTTLLLCLPYFLQILEEIKMDVEFFFFRHKNFSWPELQLWPHGNFNEEIEYLDKYFKDGKAQIIGSNELDSWHIYIADYRKNKKTEEVTIEILMNDLDKKVMQQFFKTKKNIRRNNKRFWNRRSFK